MDQQTMTEIDFEQDKSQALRQFGTVAANDPDLDIDGLDDSLLSRLIGLFQRDRR